MSDIPDDDTMVNALAEAYEQVVGEPAARMPSLDEPLSMLGLDSLDRLQVAEMTCTRWGVSLTDSAFSRVETPRDLQAAITAELTNG